MKPTKHLLLKFLFTTISIGVLASPSLSQEKSAQEKYAQEKSAQRESAPPKVTLERLSLSTNYITSSEDFLLQISLHNRGTEPLKAWVIAKIEPRQRTIIDPSLKPIWEKVQLAPATKRNFFITLPTPPQSGTWQVRVDLFDSARKYSLLSAGTSHLLNFSASYAGIEDISSEMALNDVLPTVPLTDLVLPDLAWEAIQVVPASKINQFYLRGLLINQGGSPATHIIIHGIYATPEQPSIFQSLETPVLINRLAPGEQIWIELKDVFPPQVKNPTRLGMQADPTNLLPEVLETNNTVHASPFAFR